jgi:hypothetical protein
VLIIKILKYILTILKNLGGIEPPSILGSAFRRTSPYAEERFALIRCYHHSKKSPVC